MAAVAAHVEPQYLQPPLSPIATHLETQCSTHRAPKTPICFMPCPHTMQGLLGAAFLNMALLMGLHAKHEVLDRSMHFILFLAFGLTSVLAFFEAARPHSTALRYACACVSVRGGMGVCGAPALTFARALVKSMT